MSFRSLAPLSIGRVVHRLPRRYVARPLSTSGSHGSNEPSKDQDSVKAKLQSLWKNYGMLAITTYLGIYGTTLGTMFFALDNGLLSSSAMGIDHIQAIQKVRILF